MMCVELLSSALSLAFCLVGNRFGYGLRFLGGMRMRRTTL